MNKTVKLIIVATLLIAIGIVITVKQQEKNSGVTEPTQSENYSNSVALPKLIDLGGGTCPPCKLMIPVLDQLKEDYNGKLHVLYINAKNNPDEFKKYGLKMIPTQIFYDASGKELFRHEGFYSKDNIVAKWKELGIDLNKTPASNEGVH